MDPREGKRYFSSDHASEEKREAYFNFPHVYQTTPPISQNHQKEEASSVPFSMSNTLYPITTSHGQISTSDHQFIEKQQDPSQPTHQQGKNYIYHFNFLIYINFL